MDLSEPIHIVTAARFEAEPTLESLTRHGVMHEYHELGIGPMNASHRLVSLSAALRGKQVIVLGSCGVFAGFNGPTLVTANAVHWLSAGQRHGLSESPEWLHPSLACEPSSFELPGVQVITAPEISFEPVINQQSLNVIGSEPAFIVENMELYPCVKWLAPVARSFDVILGITNAITKSEINAYKIVADYYTG